MVPVMGPQLLKTALTIGSTSELEALLGFRALLFGVSQPFR